MVTFDSLNAKYLLVPVLIHTLHSMIDYCHIYTLNDPGHINGECVTMILGRMCESIDRSATPWFEEFFSFYSIIIK